MSPAEPHREPRRCAECGQTEDKHRRVDTPEGPTFFCDDEPSGQDAPRAEIPWRAGDAIESWDRILTNLEDRSSVALQFARGAIEIVRLVDRQSAPEAWQQVVDDLHAMGRRHGLSGAALQGLMAAATAAPRDGQIGQVVPIGNRAEPPPVEGPEAYGLPDDRATAPRPLITVNPATWRGTEPIELRWLAQGRIRANDLAILSGNGGAGKTEIAVHLLVSVAADLGDWLGCVVDAGPVLFVSCEEDETDVRDRVERIAKHRNIDPHAIEDLHLLFPDLAATWLGTAEPRTGRISKTPLLIQIEAWIQHHRPRLVVIDSVAAVFDGDAIQRRQVARRRHPVARPSQRARHGRRHRHGQFR
jgi:hypothetical protein